MWSSLIVGAHFEHMQTQLNENLKDSYSHRNLHDLQEHMPLEMYGNNFALSSFCSTLSYNVAANIACLPISIEHSIPLSG